MGVEGIYPEFQCQSVLVRGWYISHGETSFRGYILTTEPQGTARKQEYIFSYALRARNLNYLNLFSLSAQGS